MMTFLLLQLSDAAFPAGGYAHSAGLEAMLRFARLDLAGVERFFCDSIEQATQASLPFVRAACRTSGDPLQLDSLDRLCDASLLSHVANRASRAQGRAFANAAARIFDVAVRAPCSHHAPVFGAVCGALRLSPDDAATAFLHGVARGVLSAAVRLGAIGTLESQRVLAAHAELLAKSIERDVAIEDVAQTAPLIEMFGALHDRLDGRLFQS